MKKQRINNNLNDDILNEILLEIIDRLTKSYHKLEYYEKVLPINEISTNISNNKPVTKSHAMIKKYNETKQAVMLLEKYFLELEQQQYTYIHAMEKYFSCRPDHPQMITYMMLRNHMDLGRVAKFNNSFTLSKSK